MLGILADLGHKNVRNEILNGPAESEQKSALYLAAENGRAELVNELLNISGHLIIFEPTGDTVCISSHCQNSLIGLDFTRGNCFKRHRNSQNNPSKISIFDGRFKSREKFANSLGLSASFCHNLNIILN